MLPRKWKLELQILLLQFLRLRPGRKNFDKLKDVLTLLLVFSEVAIHATEVGALRSVDCPAHLP
jgi:hypothetical protein